MMPGEKKRQERSKPHTMNGENKGDIKPNTVGESCLDPSWVKSNVNPLSETRGDSRAQLGVWRYSETVTCVRCLGFVILSEIPPSLAFPCLELHMEVFRGKMMKCQEFSLMYYRKKEKEEEGMGRCKCGEMLIIVEPGDGVYLQLKTFSIYIKKQTRKGLGNASVLVSKWYVTLCEAHNYTSEFSVKESECGVGQDQMVTLTLPLVNWVIFKKNYIYLFLAVLGSSFPSSCSNRRLL